LEGSGWTDRSKWRPISYVSQLLRASDVPSTIGMAADLVGLRIHNRDREHLPLIWNVRSTRPRRGAHTIYPWHRFRMYYAVGLLSAVFPSATDAVLPAVALCGGGTGIGTRMVGPANSGLVCHRVQSSRTRASSYRLLSWALTSSRSILPAVAMAWATAVLPLVASGASQASSMALTLSPAASRSLVFWPKRQTTMAWPSRSASAKCSVF
jgi:hypothetical protein